MLIVDLLEKVDIDEDQATGFSLGRMALDMIEQDIRLDEEAAAVGQLGEKVVLGVEAQHPLHPAALIL